MTLNEIADLITRVAQELPQASQYHELVAIAAELRAMPEAPDPCWLLAVEQMKAQNKQLLDALRKCAPADGIDVEQRNGRDMCAWCGDSGRWVDDKLGYVPNHSKDCGWVIARAAIAAAEAQQAPAGKESAKGQEPGEQSIFPAIQSSASCSVLNCIAPVAIRVPG